MIARDEALLDVAAAASVLGVTERWVRRAIAERRLPFVKVGRNCRFRPEDLRVYIDKHRVPACER